LPKPHEGLAARAQEPGAGEARGEAERRGRPPTRFPERAGGDRVYQANVALHIPGEFGYSPHWNVNIVSTAWDKTLADILASPYVSEHYPEAPFDDAADILMAQADGLITIQRSGVVVLCPVISERGAEAPGNTELPEVFAPFPDTF
jgi:hypothetical protein